MDFTTEQHAAINQTGDLVVTAGAGSGKTRVLVERYMRLLEAHPADPATAVDTLLAITFTEKAAREMRERVRQAVENRAGAAPVAERGLWQERRAAIEAARIGTIHSFCASILRAHPVETGLDPRFTVLDEVESGALVAECVAAALHEALGAPEAPFAVLLEAMGPAELRTTLADMLRSRGRLQAALAAVPTDGPGLLLHWRARAATAQRQALAELLAEPAWRSAAAQVTALATNAPPADKLGEQVQAMAALLAQMSAGATLELAQIDNINLVGGKAKAWGGDEPLREARAALRTLRERYRASADLLAPVENTALEQQAALLASALGRLAGLAMAHLQERKASQDLLDFDDLEQRARRLLETHAAVRRRWQGELRAVLVDEFQDTNDDQRAIVYALTNRGGWPLEQGALAGERPELFIVGDGKQSIYRFRGADVSVFSQVERDLLASGGRRVELATSFRSHPALVGWINQVSAAIFARPGPPRSYEFPFAALRAQRALAPHDHCVELHLVQAEGDASARRAAEAQQLVAQIKAIVDGQEPLVFSHETGWRTAGYGDVALLFQASGSFEHYEEALRGADIPFLTTAGRGYYGRKEIQDLLHLLRVLDEPADDLALVGVLRSPLFALDDGTIMGLSFAGRRTLWDALMTWQAERAHAADEHQRVVTVAFARDTLRELHGVRGRHTVVELLRAVLAATGYLATISGLRDGERRRANVEKLISAARLSGTRGLRTFRDYLDRLLGAEVREGEAPLEAENSVRLMTIHRSKGLEFPIVGLPDLGRSPPTQRAGWLAHPEEGLCLPLRDAGGEPQRPLAMLRALHAERQMERAERERLLYVALTRAQDYLLLSGTCATSDGDDWLSRLLHALGSTWAAGGPPAGLLGPLQIVRHGASVEV